MPPLVSVIVPVYNGEQYLADALDSILTQTHAPLEVIVVDDESTDGTSQVADRYRDRVTLIHQVNAGPAAARNTAIARASGELIAFLDADDMWEPGKLRAQVDHLVTHPDCQCVSTKIRHVIEPGNEEFLRYRQGWMDGGAVSRLLSTLLVRRGVFGVVGLLDPTFRFGEDIDWLSRLDDKGIRCDAIDRVLVRKRVHKNNVTNLTQSMHKDTLRALHQAIQRRRGSLGDRG